MSPTEDVGHHRPGAPAPTAADWAVVAGMSLFGVFVTVLAFFHLPAYVGTIPLPLSILVLVGFTWLLPRTAYRLTGRMMAALAPAVVMAATVVVLVSWSNTPLYQLPLRVISIDRATNTAGEDWRTYVLLGVVALTAAVTLALLWSERATASVRGESGPGPRGTATTVTTATSKEPDTGSVQTPVDTGQERRK